MDKDPRKKRHSAPAFRSKHHDAAKLRYGHRIGLPFLQGIRQRERRLFLPVHQNDIALGTAGPVKILQQLAVVCMAGEGIHLPDSGAHAVLLAQDRDLLPSVDDLTSQGMFRAIPYKKDGILRIADVVCQMVQDASGLAHAGSGNDDGLAVHPVQCLGLPC